jgi:hypothetical protein
MERNMRKRILVVRKADKIAAVIKDALDNTAFDVKFQTGLSGVVASEAGISAF